MKYNSGNNFDFQDAINREILEIDQKISENSKALLDAQIVKLKSTFSKSNNFIENIGTNIYKQKLQDSINWHQKQLKTLYYKRRELQIDLEKIKGIFWVNKIKRFLAIILIAFFLMLTLFIFLSGFIIIIYLLPLIILIFFGYWMINKKY